MEEVRESSSTMLGDAANVSHCAADYKWARGFDPALIHSVHYICHPGLRQAVDHFLSYETENNVELREYLMERSAVGGTGATPP